MGHPIAQADHSLFVRPLLLQSVNVSIKDQTKCQPSQCQVFSPFRVVYNDILRGNYLTGAFKSANFVTKIKHQTARRGQRKMRHELVNISFDL